MSGFTSNMTVITAIETTDTKFVLHSGDTTSKHLLSVEQSSAITSITAGAGTPSLRVDGVDIGSTTRGSLYALLSDGNPHVITMSGADLTTWSEFGISNFAAGWFLNGKKLTEEEHRKAVDKGTCAGKVVEIDGVKYVLKEV